MFNNIDFKIIEFFKKINIPLIRISLFVVFFWFGILKVLGLSPASELVHKLFEQTIPFLSFDLFLIWFGVFECIIGCLFLIPKMDRLVIPLLFIHIITTIGPLVLLPEETWQSFLVPTMAGQYIIKNVLIIACAVGIISSVKPISNQK